MHLLGNHNILTEHKITFLCSRQCPASIVLKSYDGAIAMRQQGQCVISGFHSKIEQDVLHFLLKGHQFVILALARGLKKGYEPPIQQALNENRLLIISPFSESIKRSSAKTAFKRNQIMAELADEVFIAYAAPESKLINNT